MKNTALKTAFLFRASLIYVSESYRAAAGKKKDLQMDYIHEGKVTEKQTHIHDNVNYVIIMM